MARSVMLCCERNLSVSFEVWPRSSLTLLLCPARSPSTTAALPSTRLSITRIDRREAEKTAIGQHNSLATALDHPFLFEIHLNSVFASHIYYHAFYYIKSRLFKLPLIHKITFLSTIKQAKYCCTILPLTLYNGVPQIAGCKCGICMYIVPVLSLWAFIGALLMLFLSILSTYLSRCILKSC